MSSICRFRYRRASKFTLPRHAVRLHSICRSIVVFHCVHRRLQQALPFHAGELMHNKLADVYTLNGQYDEALESYHFAIR